jgi:hypothetical protein
MSIWTILIMSILCLATSINCLKQRDYPHSLMWFAYALANSALLWYETGKK